MDSFELNKIAGAVLFALLVAFGLSIFSDIIFETEVPETPGYAIAVAETPAGGEHGGGAAPASEPIAVLLAKADPTAGEGAAKKCLGCHSFAQGEPNKTGPNLWEIVNRPIASHEGYEYSAPMHAFAEQAKTWDYEHLNAFLLNPQGTVPKTKMSFPGLKNDGERANVIAYLRTLAASPAPLPQAAAAEPAAPAEAAAAPAAEGAPHGAGEPAAAQAPTPEAAPAEQQAAQPATPPAAPAAPAEPPAAPAEQQAAQPATPPATPAAPAEQPVAPAEQQAAQPATPAPAAPAAEPAAPAEQQVAQQEPAPAAPAPAVPTEPSAPAAEAPAAPAAAPAGGFEALVAAGDVAKGETFAKRCGACHTFEKDGANKVGPHLWGIVDRPIASVADFQYSPAMTEFAAGGKTWTYDELSAYLENPKAYVPNNKMAFPGVKKEADRANLIAYLRSLADTPAPLAAQ